MMPPAGHCMRWRMRSAVRPRSKHAGNTRTRVATGVSRLVDRYRSTPCSSHACNVNSSVGHAHAAVDCSSAASALRCSAAEAGRGGPAAGWRPRLARVHVAARGGLSARGRRERRTSPLPMQLQRSRPLPGTCRRRRAGARRGGARPACSTAQENQRPVNTGNAARMPEFRENLVRGRGRFCRAVIKAQASRWGSRDGGGGPPWGSRSTSRVRVSVTSESTAC